MAKYKGDKISFVLLSLTEWLLYLELLILSSNIRKMNKREALGE